MAFFGYFAISLLETLDKYSGALVALGWFVVFFLGILATKLHQRNVARLEIYRELQGLKSAADKSSIDLGVLLSKFSLPFLAMEWSEKSSIGIGEGKTPGQHWLEYNKKIIDAVSKFDEVSQVFLNAANIWIAIMPSLKTARNTLAAEISGLSSELWAYVQYHQSQPGKEYDWKKWNRAEIEGETDKIQKKFDRVACGFLNDFADELFDELMRPIFNIKKIRREDFNYTQPIEAETLTKKGIKMIKYKPTEVALMLREKWKQVKK